MYMKDWGAELDDFAKRYGKGILSDSGAVSLRLPCKKPKQSTKNTAKRQPASFRRQSAIFWKA